MSFLLLLCFVIVDRQAEQQESAEQRVDHTKGAPGLEQYGTTDKMEGVIYDMPNWSTGANNLPSAGRAQGEPLQPEIKRMPVRQQIRNFG